MDPKWYRNVTQDGSFHGTQDGVCGYLSDGVNIQKTVQEAQDDQQNHLKRPDTLKFLRFGAQNVPQEGGFHVS